MKDSVSICLDPASKLSLAVADCTSAAREAARGHLSGPAASAALAEALACAAVAGAESSAQEEAVSFRADCPEGPVGGFLAEAANGGTTLRGYTKKKILDEFDGMGAPPPRKLYGANATVETIRSIPGKILSSGVTAIQVPAKGSFPAAALAALYGVSLQRKAAVEAFASAGDDGEPVMARAALLECPPDGDADAFEAAKAAFDSGAVRKALASVSSLRTLLGKCGLARAEIRETRPLSFACRCSLERARNMIAALPAEDRAELAAAGKSVDIYCHFCGKLWQVAPDDPVFAKREECK